MDVKKGDRIRNILTGKAYEVKKVNREWVVLQEVEGLSQVLTGKMGLGFSYILEGTPKPRPEIIPSFPNLGSKAGEPSKG